MRKCKQYRSEEVEWFCNFNEIDMNARSHVFELV